MSIYLVIGSVTKALKGTEALYKSGINAVMTKPPKSPNLEGCTYSIKISPKDEKKSMEILKTANINVKSVFRE